jgi:L-ascorbate 6-phosphate lactonase
MAETGAPFVGPPESVAVGKHAWPEAWPVTADQFRTVEPGETFDLGEFDVSVYRANDPDADGPVAYAFEHEAGTFVHGGDARPGDFGRIANRHDVDVAALAFGSAGMIPDKETREPDYTKWYSDENEVVEAARELEADTLLPTHWDMWKGLTAEPTALHEHVRSFEYPETLETLEIGDRYDFD